MNVFVAGISVVVVLGLALFLVLTVTGVARAVKNRDTGRPLGPAPGSAPPSQDPAAQELRLRYARGEISREEYLQRKIDLEEF